MQQPFICQWGTLEIQRVFRLQTAERLPQKLSHIINMYYRDASYRPQMSQDRTKKTLP
ncbi:hypothetical protein I79_000045 [Cricetulus griseus]|uniref:Uncharacterized protein n=1 Tax=Cricetulus griseus TaxID=10029 RepID=G3GRA2_CRIGR|nr:hypothetical protein I79_000045 [Cricetulus griseus]